MGLFTPAWDNPKADRDKIAKAIRKINDQEKLKSIYQNAKNSVVAENETILLIEDESFIVDFIIKRYGDLYDNTRKKVATRVVSEDALTELACNKYNDTEYAGWIIAGKAAEKIKKKGNLLKLLESKNRDIRWTALKALNDPKLYANEVVNDRWNGEKALEQIKDEKTRIDLLAKINSDRLLDKCLSSLSDSGYEPDEAMLDILLKKVSNNSFRESTRLVISFIKDEKALNDLALHSEYYYIRGAALSRVTDEKILAEVAMNDDEDFPYRSYAYEKLKNKSLVDEKTHNYIRENDPKYWSEEDRRLADIMAADSY